MKTTTDKPRKTQSCESAAMTFLLQSERFPETRKTLLVEIESLIMPCKTNAEIIAVLGISEPSWYRYRHTLPDVQKLHDKWRRYVDAD